MRGAITSYWALDRNGGEKVLVTHENRQLYTNSVRYIKLHNEPVPKSQDAIDEILAEQYEKGLKREDFTQADIEAAATGLTGRRFRRQQQQQAELPPELQSPPTEATTENMAQSSPDEVQFAEEDPAPEPELAEADGVDETVPDEAPAKAPSTKKAAKKSK